MKNIYTSTPAPQRGWDGTFETGDCDDDHIAVKQGNTELFSCEFDVQDSCCGIDELNAFDGKLFRGDVKLDEPKMFADAFNRRVRKVCDSQSGDKRGGYVRMVFKNSEFKTVMDALVKHGNWKIFGKWYNTNSQNTLVGIGKVMRVSRKTKNKQAQYGY